MHCNFLLKLISFAMEESSKVKIRLRHSKSDYSLRRIHVYPACDEKNISDVLENKFTRADDATEKEVNNFKRMQRFASGIIISALTYTTLRVIRSVFGNACNMIAKLNQRFDSKSPASKISCMSEFLTLRCSQSRKTYLITSARWEYFLKRSR